MASLLNNASLLLNPAGSIIAYKEDKIFSVLPSNGAGDFTFSGGDGGTRVNQQGYIEPTPANLLSNTNTFSGWNLEGGTITGGFPDPEGGNTAYKYTAIGGNGLWSNLVAFGVAIGYGSGYPLPGSITFSFWIKSVTGNNMTATIGDGVATSGGTVNITGTWQYITRTITPLGPWGGFYLNGLSDATNGYYIWHPQINIGSTALPYQPTTDRLNYPRITYQNGRGALLSEPQRTNYVLYSNSCAWTTQVGASLTFSSSISPDGTQNATTLNVGTGNYSGTYYFVNRGSEQATVSIFAKAGTLPFLYFLNTAGNTAVAWYDLRNGTVSNVNGSYTAYMEPYRDGWYRCVLIGPTQNNVYIQIGATDVSGNFAASYAGNIQIWGGQNETGGFPTSYIPTTTATVTRPVEIFNDSSATSVIGQTEGTMFVDFVWTDLGALYPEISLYGNNNNRVGIYTWDQPSVGNDTLRAFVIGSGASPFESNISNTLVRGQRYKAAFAYKSGDSVAYVNGVNTFSNGGTFTFNTSLSEIRSNTAYPWSNNTHQFGLYTSRLTNTQLAELTTVRSGSGGNISYYGPYTIHTFTGSATFTPSFTGQVEVLVVAGGGGGGNANDAFWEAGGGGGAGGLLYASSYGVSAGTGITVTVGAGGTGGRGIANPRSGNGSNSVFGGLTAIGGGGGGGAYYAATSGGSGGGGDAYYGAGALGIPYGTGITGQGNRGGSGNLISSLSGAGGGGGGAGAIGGTGQASGNYTGGTGGDGLPYSISGFSNYYAGGGGGKTAGNGSGAGGAGGLGGGGTGGAAGNVAVGTSGVDYTGGGGGGAMATSTYTGNGGTGVVIVRYLT